MHMASLVVTLIMKLAFGILEQDTLVMNWVGLFQEIRWDMSMGLGYIMGILRRCLRWIRVVKLYHWLLEE